jgi:3-isopropylmalate dehydrogenase
MKRILLVPGDGIGPEVMTEAKALLSLLAKKFSLGMVFQEVDWGAERYLKEGIGLPQGALATIPTTYDAILFGALGDPRIPDMAHGREILLGLRFGLDLFINLRPIKLMHPSLGVLRDNPNIDMVIFRENTEDVYLGLGNVVHQGCDEEVVIDESKHSFHGVYRIIKAAFMYARLHNRKSVTLVDKANAIKFAGRLWQRVFYELSKEYPDIKATHLYVDVAAMKMVQDPGSFDVIVTSNLFGDILSDLGAGLIGGLGLCGSANSHPGVIALFEPVHGSAPDIAGKNLANPFAMFMSVAMMMSYLGYQELAVVIEQAIARSLELGLTTKDLRGSLSCSEASLQILQYIENCH